MSSPYLDRLISDLYAKPSGPREECAALALTTMRALLMAHILSYEEGCKDGDAQYDYKTIEASKQFLATPLPA